MTEEIENIVKSKSFQELNKDELMAIQEFARTNEEYLLLQSLVNFDIASHKSKKERLSENIKQNLDQQFKAHYQRNRLVWYNQLWLFIWPEEKHFVLRPLFVMVAIAVTLAVRVLFIPFAENEILVASVEQIEKVVENEMGDVVTKIQEEETSEGDMEKISATSLSNEKDNYSKSFEEKKIVSKEVTVPPTLLSSGLDSPLSNERTSKSLNKDMEYQSEITFDQQLNSMELEEPAIFTNAATLREKDNNQLNAGNTKSVAANSKLRSSIKTQDLLSLAEPLY